jgi:hypothetical protein
MKRCGGEAGARHQSLYRPVPGDRFVVETVELADEVRLPFIVLGELRAGFVVGRLVMGSPGPRNEAVLRRFLLKSGVGVLYADEQTTSLRRRFPATA